MYQDQGCLQFQIWHWNLKCVASCDHAGHAWHHAGHNSTHLPHCCMPSLPLCSWPLHWNDCSILAHCPVSLKLIWQRYTPTRWPYPQVLQPPDCLYAPCLHRWIGHLGTVEVQAVPEKISFQNFLADISGPTSWATLGQGSLFFIWQGENSRF